MFKEIKDRSNKALADSASQKQILTRNTHKDSGYNEPTAYKDGGDACCKRKS